MANLTLHYHLIRLPVKGRVSIPLKTDTYEVAF